MKSKTWVWVTLVTVLALGIGVVAFQLAFGFSSAIVFDGASYPKRAPSAPLALSWTRDLSGKLGQLFQSEYSHLYRIPFSIDGQLVAPFLRGGSPDVQCKLYELSEEPKHVELRQIPTPSSAFWAAAICEEKHSKRTAWKQTRDLVGSVFKNTTIPLAHVAGQTFAATQNGLCGITTILGSGPQKDHGKLAFHVFSKDDPNKDLFTQEIAAGDISEEQIMTFDFEPIEDSRFKRYGFYFTSPDCGPLQAPRMLATKTDIEPNGEAWIDYRSQRYDVVFKAQYCGAERESLQVPPGVVVQQLADVDIEDYKAVREGRPSYRGSENGEHKAVFEFPALVGSSSKYYFLILEINGVSVPCQSFLCQHSVGTLPETLRHIVGTLMIDKPPCVRKEHIVVLACLLFFLLAVFVNCLGLYGSCKRVPAGTERGAQAGECGGVAEGMEATKDKTNDTEGD
ncbi:MAG: hypothetical protein JW759_07060 [Candidatus Coatesbacteria bacterium]|nr:hypothetical protein [Candidatus Coatesbacteria bacterium]